MSKRKFYKQVIVVTVLSEDSPLRECELDEVHYAITHGDCSGETKWASPVDLTGKEAADALVAQGSDPGFFGLKEDGTDLDDEEATP